MLIFGSLFSQNKGRREEKSFAKGGRGLNLKLCNKATPQIVGNFELETLTGKKKTHFPAFFLVISD